jgi:6-phosphogluconolactonase
VRSYAGELNAQRNYPSEIVTSQDGKFLYVSNRGQNTIAEFKINRNKGTLSYLNEISTFGDFPRDFDIDSSGKYLVVANQKSDSITLFTINQTSGVLNYIG